MIEPVGLEPPDSVAESVTCVPSEPPADAVVAIVGRVLSIVTVSPVAPQAPTAGLLLVSPE
ncbi:MAG: hypothetical protein HUU35_02300 [Armatimonadetes bacterium]|nr:hypothetical protein [Armatimonadota bacterium]